MSPLTLNASIKSQTHGLACEQAFCRVGNWEEGKAKRPVGKHLGPPVGHKLSSLNRKSSLLAQGEILRIQMLALVQRCLDHCQPARSYLLEMPKTGPVLILLPEINEFLQNRH